jgi:hypothetical protein
MFMAVKQLLLPIALLLAGIFADSSPAFAATRAKTWLWDEILAPPMRELEPYDCSRTHPVRTISNFGNGLVSDYIIEVSAGEPDAISKKIDDFNKSGNGTDSDARVAKLTLPKRFPNGGGLITVQDNVVLTNIDDLLQRYFSVCQLARDPSLMLRSITYHPASLRERAEVPVRASWYYLSDLPIPPVLIQTLSNDPGLLPLPVVGGDYQFATSFDPLPTDSKLIPMQEGHLWHLDPSKVAIGTGVHLAALFLGHNDLDTMKPLADDGFDVLTIEIGGRIETLVIDRHVLVSADQLAARTIQVMRYRWFDTSLRLTRLVFYPAVLGGIDALRSNQGRDLKRQVAKRHGLELAEEYTRLMSYLPQNEDTELLLKVEWSKFAGSTTGAGYDSIFGAPGSNFGKLENISCEPNDAEFICKAGVTFTIAKHPEYAERTVYFERHWRESGLLELEPAATRAPAYDPLRVSAPPPATDTSVGPRTTPTIPEVQQLIAAGWTHAPASIFTGNTQDIEARNFASVFTNYDTLRATFGEVHDLACTETDSVFTCTVGVTYMLDGVPRYGRSEYQMFQRVRDADSAWNLKAFLETDIIVTDALRAPHR